MSEYRRKLLGSIGTLIPYEHIGPLQWHLISFMDLSEEFIREFANELDWGAISRTSKLSDNFLLENKERIPWGIYLHFQPSSFAIIKQFILKIEPHLLNDIYISHLTEFQKQEIQKLIDLKNIFKKNEHPL